MVSGQPIGPIFKREGIQEGKLNFLTPEDGASRLSRNVGNKLPLYAA